MPDKPRALRPQPAPTTPAAPPLLVAAKKLYGENLLGVDQQMRLLGDPCSDGSQRCSNLTLKVHLALLQYKGNQGCTRSIGYWTCLAHKERVRTFDSGTGTYMLALQDVFAAGGNTSPSVCTSFMNRSVWCAGKPLAYLVVIERHTGGTETPMMFAPLEVVLDIVTEWWERCRSVTCEKLAGSAEMLIGDLKARLPKVRHMTNEAQLTGL